MYRFNRVSGIPTATHPQINNFLKRHLDKPVRLSDHALERMQEKGIDPKKIPGWNGTFPKGSDGWRIHEIEHDGNAVRKLLLRAPLDEHNDITMPIREGGMIPSVWVNKKEDNRTSAERPLNGHRVHYPEEFAPGLPPSRELDSPLENRFIPHTDNNFKENVLNQHSYDTRKAKGITASLPILNFEFLKTALFGISTKYIKMYL